jgi:hypothetical protein
VKFHKTDIKLLYDQLADPALQARFDKEAMKKLLEWEDMVSYASTSYAISG